MNATIVIRRPHPEDFDMDALLPLQTKMGLSNMGPNVPETDLFNSADGGYFNAGGIRAGLKKVGNARRARKAEKLKIKKIKAQGKADLRAGKGAAKVGKADAAKVQAAAQKEAAKGLSKPAPGIKMPALPKDTPDKGMSTGAIVGIVAGALVIVGVGGYLIYKATKKK